ncbi:uncharacterized protein MONBRDRAFT_25425 [Monosiga brevicollis MX1]|uniref:C2H2-type domain-containing protein n=1 Tax=Monosiga brevicollis TaxID=81824 RepID=A9UZD8_MONBE|nr:uncharacterized protein MONBRDRAFT_25425 [Monosiga brevicollis MX1]EDQ89214.1 predicted protein [Monosiga brevicollis MX1]|eukprot:XP_001745790.1 hypothetical protein [Monosiga brevicollis MX1]
MAGLMTVSWAAAELRAAVVGALSGGGGEDVVERGEEAVVPVMDASEVPADAHVVLLLGEGNFSFARALAELLRQHKQYREPALSHPGNANVQPNADQIAREHAQDQARARLLNEFLGQDAVPLLDRILVIATSFDSQKEVLEKYPESRPILDFLENQPCFRVLHCINAWQVHQHFANISLHHIGWNHPHLGQEDFRLHRFLMSHLFESLQQTLPQDGRVTVSLVEGQVDRWDIIHQAAQKSFELVLRDRFLPRAWPGYETKRNRNAQSFQNRHTQLHHRNDMRSNLLAFARRAAPVDAAPAPAPVATAPAAATEATGSEHACQHCGKIFTSARGVKTHTRQVHELQKYKNWQPDRTANLPCPSCDKLFTDDVALWQHRVAKHSAHVAEGPRGPVTESIAQALTSPDVHWIPCPVCGQAIPDHWPMEQHLEMLKPLVGQRAACLQCDRVFTEHRALAQHLNFCRTPDSARPQELIQASRRFRKVGPQSATSLATEPQ